MHFLIYGLRNTSLEKCLKCPVSEEPLRSDMVNRSKHLKSERQHLYHIYWSLWRIVELKKSLWLTCKVWGLCFNPLTVDDKYSLLNRGNLLQHFQMHLSEKRKIFIEFFFTFSKLRFNFEHFQKNMSLIADAFFNIRTPKYVVREMSKMSRFGGAFEKWHGKQVETLEIWTTAPLPYLLIPLKNSRVEKVSLTDMQSLRTVF